MPQRGVPRTRTGQRLIERLVPYRDGTSFPYLKRHRRCAHAYGGGAFCSQCAVAAAERAQEREQDGTVYDHGDDAASWWVDRRGSTDSHGDGSRASPRSRGGAATANTNNTGLQSTGMVRPLSFASLDVNTARAGGGSATGARAVPRAGASPLARSASFNLMRARGKDAPGDGAPSPTRSPGRASPTGGRSPSASPRSPLDDGRRSPGVRSSGRASPTAFVDASPRPRGHGTATAGSSAPGGTSRGGWSTRRSQMSGTGPGGATTASTPRSLRRQRRMREPAAVVVAHGTRKFRQEQALDATRPPLVVPRVWDTPPPEVSRRRARAERRRERQWCAGQYSPMERRMGIATNSPGVGVLDPVSQLHAPGYWTRQAPTGEPDTKSAPAIRHRLREARQGEDTATAVAHIPETVRPEMVAVLEGVSRKVHEQRMRQPIDWRTGKRVSGAELTQLRRTRKRASVASATAHAAPGGVRITAGRRGRAASRQSASAVAMYQDARRQRKSKLAHNEDALPQYAAHSALAAARSKRRAARLPVSPDGDGGSTGGSSGGQPSPSDRPRGDGEGGAVADSPGRGSKPGTQGGAYEVFTVEEAMRKQAEIAAKAKARPHGSTIRRPGPVSLGRQGNGGRRTVRVASLAEAKRTKQKQAAFEEARRQKLASWAAKHEASRQADAALKEELRLVKMIMGGV